MRTRIENLVDALRTSYWFVPTVMALNAILLAFLLPYLDRQYNLQEIELFRSLYAGGAEGARQLLATTAGSMITVAGTIFSITIAVLSLTSSQFGSLLLKNFMRDRTNQIVLGTFISTFIYCLLVLGTVRGTDGAEFIPYLSVSAGIIMAIGSVGVLIYFIHHMAASIQPANVIASIGYDLDRTIDRLFPQRLGQDPPEAYLAHDGARPIPETFEQEAAPITTGNTGYIQMISDDELMALAKAHDLLIKLLQRPGHYVAEETVVARIWPADNITEEINKAISDTFIVGADRTVPQDVEYAIHQLVEIAVRALSPGINDPYTANNCIDRLGAALCRLAPRDIPSPYRYDENRMLRLIVDPLTFEHIANSVFDQIRQNGQTIPAVTIRLFEAIETVGPCLQRPEDREVLRRQAIMLERGTHETNLAEWDRIAVQKHYRAALQALEPDLEDRKGPVIMR